MADSHDAESLRASRMAAGNLEGKLIVTSNCFVCHKECLLIM